MATEIWIKIGSGNGLLPDGNKPVPEPMTTNHQGDLMAFLWGGCGGGGLLYNGVDISAVIYNQCPSGYEISTTSKLQFTNISSLAQKTTNSYI